MMPASTMIVAITPMPMAVATPMKGELRKAAGKMPIEEFWHLVTKVANFATTQNEGRNKTAGMRAGDKRHSDAATAIVVHKSSKDAGY